jgi:Myb/SANT-like DNA-binding domain
MLNLNNINDIQCLNAQQVMAERRIRCANTTAVEREMVLQLVQKYKDVIENKRTDAVTSAHKEKVWQRITTEFNAVGINKKDAKQLKTVKIMAICMCCI